MECGPNKGQTVLRNVGHPKTWNLLLNFLRYDLVYSVLQQPLLIVFCLMIPFVMDEDCPTNLFHKVKKTEEI